MALICGTLYVLFDTTIVPQALLTLVFAYSTVSIMCISCKVKKLEVIIIADNNI